MRRRSTRKSSVEASEDVPDPPETVRRSTRKPSVGVSEDAPNQSGSFSTRFSLPSFVDRVEKLTDDQRNAIKRVGFGNLLLIPNHMLSKNLLLELMERWSCQEHAFILLPGSIKITLLDVALILGLPVVGEPVSLKDDEPFSELERDYGAILLKRKITLASLESRLHILGDEVSEDFVRTFVLFMFVTLLFPNSSRNIDSRYLSFLENLDNVRSFSWGEAVLEHLIMWLDKRKEMNVQYIGGCLILLQIWSYEHIDLARPGLMDSYFTFPRACRWENSRSNQRQWFSAKFKELQDSQITWELQPTSMELESDVIKELLKAQKTRKRVTSLEFNSNASLDSDVSGFKPDSDVNCPNELEASSREAASLEQPTEPNNLQEIFKDSPRIQVAPNVSEIKDENVELSPMRQHSPVNFTTDNASGHKAESDASYVDKVDVPSVEAVSLKEPTASNHIQKPHIDSTKIPFTSSFFELDKNNQGPVKFTVGNENNLIERNRVLELQVVELTKEIETLRMENRQLRDQIMSTNILVDRLEGIIMDETEL